VTWFRRSEATATTGSAPAAPVAPPTSPPPPAHHPAPGLKLALDRHARPGCAVLELGPLLAANLAVFNAAGVRLRVLDLESVLAEESFGDLPAAAWERRLGELLRFGEQERFDLVLAWDLPNYFPRERWLPLAQRIGAHLAPAGAVHVLARTGREMPARPSRFRIEQSGVLDEEILTHAHVPAPRFSHHEVETLHPGLAAAKSFLGKQGMQEYLLEHSEELHLPPRRVAQARNRPPSPAIRVPYVPQPRKPADR
jgi:hypothetical protein